MRLNPVPLERALVLERELGSDPSPTADVSRTPVPALNGDPDRSRISRLLVVGDLHVGLEAEYARSGIRLPSQTQAMRARLSRLLSTTGAERLVIIGDLKHRIPVSSFQEERELGSFFANVGAPVTLVRGNHDVDVPPLLNATVHDSWGLRVDDALLLHGHTWPEDADMDGVAHVVTCHNHPMVLLVDELGRRHKEPCWVRAPFTDAAYARYPGLSRGARLVVVPAFNDLLGGIAFNGDEGKRLLGPLFGNALVDVDAARIFTLDGVDLGALADLREFGREPEASPGPRRLAGPRRARPRGDAAYHPTKRATRRRSSGSAGEDRQ